MDFLMYVLIFGAVATAAWYIRKRIKRPESDGVDRGTVTPPRSDREKGQTRDPGKVRKE